MPMAPGKGWGMSVGVGSYESESAIAAGLTFAGEKVNFKFAAGNSGGELHCQQVLLGTSTLSDTKGRLYAGLFCAH